MISPARVRLSSVYAEAEMPFRKTVNLNTVIRTNILPRWKALVKIGDFEDVKDPSIGNLTWVRVGDHRARTFYEKIFDWQEDL